MVTYFESGLSYPYVSYHPRTLTDPFRMVVTNPPVFSSDYDQEDLIIRWTCTGAGGIPPDGSSDFYASVGDTVEFDWADPFVDENWNNSSGFARVFGTIFCRVYRTIGGLSLDSVSNNFTLQNANPIVPVEEMHWDINHTGTPPPGGIGTMWDDAYSDVNPGRTTVEFSYTSGSVYDPDSFNTLTGHWYSHSRGVVEATPPTWNFLTHLRSNELSSGGIANIGGVDYGYKTTSLYFEVFDSDGGRGYRVFDTYVVHVLPPPSESQRTAIGTLLG